MVNYPYSKEEIDMKKYSVWKRLGSLVLALVLVMSLMPATHTHAHAEAISGGSKLFLKPNANWKQSNAWFAMYLWNGSGVNTWASMTDSDSDGVYEGTVPAGSWTNVIFCRMNPATTVKDWSSKWDQTVDLTCDSTNNTFTVADGAWNNASGTWSHTHSLTSVTYPEGSDNIYATCHTPVYSCPNCPDGITQKGELEDHSFTDSKCDQCGYTCNHIGYMSEGACSNCGWECDHPSWTEHNGYATCYYCGIDAVAKVVDTYYLDIEEALAKAQETDGCTLTLYQNVSGLTEALTVSKGNFTILGNSNTLSGTMEGPVLKITGGTVLLSSLKVENPSTATGSRAIEITGGNVTVRGGTINAGHSGIFIPLDSDPTVTLLGGTITADRGVDNNSTASTLNLGTAAEADPTIKGTTYGVSSRGKVYFNSGSVSGEYGFYLVPGASVTLYDEYYPINATAAHFFIAGAPTGELNFRYAPSEGKYKIKATHPGTFAKPALSTVELDPAGFISVTDGLLLAKDGDNLILKQCGHENIESEATCKAGAICGICGAEVSAADPDAHVFDAATGKCGNGCGLEMAAASTTVGSTTTYYLTVQAALDAASQAETATVKLLRSDENVTGLTMTGGNVRLEMNGLTLKGSVSQSGLLQLSGAELSVVGGTVENTAADGCGIYAAYNESTHLYSTIDVDSSTVIGVQAGIMTNKAHVSVAQGAVTGTEYGILAKNAGAILLESGTVRGDVGVKSSVYGGTLTLGAEGAGGPTVYGKTYGIDSNCDITAYSGTINCPEGIGINLSWHYSGPNESAGAGLYLEGTPTIDAATDIYLDYEKSLVKSRYIQVNVALTDGAYSVDCQMDNDVIAMPGTGITLQRTWFTSANANKFVQNIAQGYLSLGPCAHSDKKAVQNEDGVTHDVFCNICQTTPEKDVPCSGGTATCKNKAVCTACGELYGELGTIHKGMDPATGYCSGGCGTRLAVAMIDKNGKLSYSRSLAAAFAEVKACVAADYARITLLDSVTLTEDITVEGGVFDLDMMGKTIDAGEYELIIEGGKIQMEDGTITGKNKGTLRVEGGELTIWRDMILDNQLTASTAICGTVIVDGGAVILNGGTVTASGDSAAVFVNSGSFTLQSGAVEQPSLMYALFLHSGEATLTGGTLSSAKEDAVFVWRGTLNVGGTAMTHGPGKYHVQCDSDQTKLNFTAATGKEYTIEASKNIPVGNLTYNSAKYAVTSTDSDLSDGSYAKGSIVTLSCAHKNVTATSNGNGTHKLVCNDCGAVAENEACSGGTATCIAKAKCAKCETEYGQLLEHAMDAATGKCKYGCGLLMAEAYVRVGNEATYYLTFEEAFAKTLRTHSLCLLKDATVESALRSVNMRELFLNGHTLTLDQGMTVDTLKLSGTGGTLKGGSDCEVLLQVTGDLELVNVSVLAECDHAVNAATLTLREATLSSNRAEIYITEFPSSGPAIDFETPYSGSALRVEFAENMNPLGMLLAEGDYYLPEDQIEIFNEGYTVSHLPSDGTDGRALYVCADLADAQVKNAPFAITYGEDIQAVLPELTLLGRTLTKDIDYTLTYPTVTGVGTVNIIATGTGRYVGELKIPVTVNKATPKYSDFMIYSPADLVYNGQPKVPQIDTTRTGMGQWTVQYMDIEKSTLESNAVDAGTYQIVLNVAEGENYTDSTVTNPFWTFQITKADVTLRMQEPNTTTSYAINKPVQIIATGADGTILGAEVTLRMIDDGKEARKDEKKTVDSTGTATYENLSKKQNGELLKAGTYTVWAAIAESKNHKAANFTKLGTYTITKADLTITKTSTGTSNKYGHNLFGIASVTGVTDDVNGLSIQLQLKNAEGAVVNSMTSAVSENKIVWNWLNELPGGGYADAGEYTIVAKFDGNAIYEASETNLGTYTIVPTPATVTAADQTITLGESISTDEDQFEVEGLLVGYRLTAITLTPSTDKVTASGEIIPMDAVIKRGDVDVTANYDITYKSGKLIVKPDASLVENLEVETVTSEDLPDIEEFLEQMENAESTEEEWDDLLDHANDLADRVEDAAAMADTDVGDLTEDTVRPETVEEAEDIQGELEAAKEQLERAKEYFGDNYTDEEETAIEDELKRVEDLLDKVEKVKPFIEAINELPETAEPDDEEAIRKLLEAVAIGNRIGEEARALAGNMDKLEKLLTDLTNYRVILGDGGKYIKGSGEALSFTANGPYKTEEVFFVALFVDGERVAEENYTAVAGSTVVTLKPEYLNSLKVGEHTLYFSYQFSGMGLNSNTAEFTVVKNAADNDVPGTGDDSQLVLWICVGSVALVTMIVLMILLLKKKGKYERNKR